jgi:4-alpha-glucanotransferase
VSAARRAGLLLPLFSLRSADDWGIGDVGQAPAFCAWMVLAGHRWWQLLPVGEIAPGERSPYAALSAFAIDPIYVSLPHVADFVAAGGEGAFDAATSARLAAARQAHGIDYDAVRAVKRRGLELAFAHFRRHGRDGAAFAAFRAAEAHWLEEYALFRALKERNRERAWREWPAELAERDGAALATARAALEPAVTFHAWVQWQADRQWNDARAAARAAGVALAGDLPFAVGADSADVWADAAGFDLAASLGAPPDAFNAEGQDWGLPPPRWSATATHDLQWLRGRVARMAALFDGCRLDHVVGYYRSWIRAAGARAAFDPPDEPAQRARGERLLGVMCEAAGDMALVAEDLGAIPDFVHASLAALGLPGYRVLRWQTDPDGAFRDPRTYPRSSVAATGTHDTSPLATWWSEELGDVDRAAVARLPGLSRLADAAATFTPAVRDELLETVYGARSALVVLPFQDAYGGRERVNVPATVGASNWGYRIPWRIDDPAMTALAAELRARAKRRRR